MARKNPYDAPAIPPMQGGLTPLRGTPPPDDQTEVALRRSKGKGVLPVDDETNFGDLDSVIGGGEMEAEVLKVDPQALARRLAGGADDDASSSSAPLPRGVRPGLQEDEPTLTGGPAPAMDPKQLARLLADQARARIAAAEQARAAAAVPDPTRTADVPRVPPPRPPAEPAVDPAALARKLAAEAKARLQVSEPPAPQPAPKEDPVALARRLAAEAKARLTPQPAQPRAAQAPPSDDRAPRVKRGASAPPPAAAAPPPRASTPPAAPPRATPSPAPARAGTVTPPPAPARAASTPPTPTRAPSTPPPAPSRAASTTPPPAPSRAPSTPPPAPGRSRLADRAPRAPSKTSAAEALQRITNPPAPSREVGPPAEQLAEPSLSWSSPEPTPEPVDVSDPGVHDEVQSSVPPEDAISESVTAPAPEHEMPPYLAAITELLPDAVIESERPVRRPSVFIALWEAHQARAVKDGHLELAGAATLLLTRVRALEAGQLVGVKITRAGRGWAAFVDATDGSVLAIVPRPEVYLAGLQ